MPDRYYAAACQFDLPNPTSRDEITNRVSRVLAVIEQTVQGYAPFFDIKLLVFPEFTHAAPIYATAEELAARLAVQKLLDAKRIAENPLTDSVAAVSVGLFKGEPLLDLNYVEDRDAEVDANVVMTGRGQFVEVQSSGEESTFSHTQLQQLLGLAQKGLGELAAAQAAFLAKHLL